MSEWLKGRQDLGETEAAEVVAGASGFPLSAEGLDSKSIAHEIQRGRDAGVTNLFAGIALVDVQGIHRLTLEQVKADLAICQGMDVDGLMLSWDLWHIPHKYISAVSGFATK